MSAHEDLDRDDETRTSSNRSFGLVFTGVFAAIGLWPLLQGASPRWWALGLAAVVLAATALKPSLLEPLNRVWTRFGLLLHRVTNPLLMALIFYLAVTPVALIMRALGKDPLRRRWEAEAESYWIERRPPGPPPETMRNQF